MTSPGLLALLMPFALAGDTDRPDPSTVLATLHGEHPRLLFRTHEFQALASHVASGGRAARWYSELRRRADELLDETPVRYEIPDGLRLLSVSRRVVQRVHTLALVHRIDGSQEHLERLWRELEAAAGFRDWNPRHFLDTAEMTHAFALAYDWLFDAWTPSRRETMREAMVRHGLEPGRSCYRGESNFGWWARGVNNWNQVCNGGLTLGALAIADERPELAGEIVAHAIASLPRALGEYAPEGGYKEGPGYWAYGTSYNVLMLAALQSALGRDFGLSSLEGFDTTGHFPIHLSGPTGRVFNFADGGDSPLRRTFPLFWLGRRFDHPLYAWFAERQARPEALDLLWYPHEKPPADFAIETEPRNSYWPGPEVVTLRGSWTDPATTFIAFKAGRPADSHAQMDLGSFILETRGIRWAVDLGGDNYNLPGYFDRKTGRWKFYRNRAEGHNTLVVAPGPGPDQEVSAEARIVRHEFSPERSRAVADLTPAYAGRAGAVRRGIALLRGVDVLVQDEITDPGGRILWFLHTRADVEIDGRGCRATLRQAGKALHAEIIEPATARFSVRPASPLEGSPSVPGQNPNNGVRKLAIDLEPGTGTRLGVWLSPSAGATPPGTLRPLASW